MSLEDLRGNFLVDDKVYVKSGKTIWKGIITEVEEWGFWLTEDKETEEFIYFKDLNNYEWAVE